MIDYTMDIRKRLNYGDNMPEELSGRKAMVLSKLKELQNEVAPLMKTMESLKDKDTAKDPKTLISVLQKEYNVRNFIFFSHFYRQII